MIPEQVRRTLSAPVPEPVAAGTWLDEEQIELGYRWAVVQIPLQYLPWTAGNRPADQVAASIDRIEVALDAL